MMLGLTRAFRTLTRTPFLTSIAVLSLALGIGANAAIFSIFDQVLLRALPVQEPDRLVNLGAPGPKPGSRSCNQAGDCDVVFSYEMFRDLEREVKSFSGLAAHRGFGANLAHSTQTMDGEGMLVSGSYFQTLGVQPALGRLLAPGDDRNIGEHFVVVLSHGYWRDRLGADTGLLNQTLVVNGQPMTIVGVAPRGFKGTTLGTEPDVFVPITMRGVMTPGFDAFDNRRNYWAYVFGRLAPEVSLEQAGAEINTIYKGIIEEVEASLQSGMSEQTMERFLGKEVLLEDGLRGQSGMQAEVRAPLILLLSITGVVLLIACANIANLLLARGASRGQEIAIRSSMGASRGQLLRRLLTESLILGILGGIGSLFVARWTLGGIIAMLPAEDTNFIMTSLRPSVLWFTAALAIGTGVVFGLYPALNSTRVDLITMLKSNAGQPSGARSAARFRSLLVTAQIALSMALLVSAGLFIKSLANISRVDLGLDAENIITFRVSPQLNGYEVAEIKALYEQMEDELAVVPGVTGVAAALVPIMTGSNWGNDVSVEGFESGPDVDANSRYNEVGPGYFRTLGMPLLAGREFTRSDIEDALLVSVINETFAKKFGLDSRDAVGKWMALGRGEELNIRIVGVVQDAKYANVKQEVPPLFFRPYKQTPRTGSITFYVKTSLAPAEILRAAPTVVRQLDANLPVENLKTLDQQIAEAVVADRILSTLSAAFAVLATLLAAIGLYGVLSYTVAQRTREIGVRMALGAGGKTVRGMVLRQVLRMTILGGSIGVIGALFIGRAADSLLFEMKGYDPIVVSIVVVVLGMVAFSAGYLPALKASKIDPMEALRYE
jgi:putative ABC transport system permease protein